jgi:hypothetical protein
VSRQFDHWQGGAGIRPEPAPRHPAPVAPAHPGPDGVIRPAGTEVVWSRPLVTHGHGRWSRMVTATGRGCGSPDDDDECAGTRPGAPGPFFLTGLKSIGA